MAQELDSEYLVCSYTSDQQDDSSVPTPTPRVARQEVSEVVEVVPVGDQQLGQLFEQTERECDFEAYKRVLEFCTDKERKDLTSIESLPQLMKDNLFFQNEDLLSSSQDRVKANPAKDEELSKFLKYLSSVVNNPQDPILQQKSQKLIEMLNTAIQIADNGHTSLQSSNKVFQNISPIFQQANSFSADKVEPSYLPLTLLKEATQSNKQRQKFLQDGNLDEAEKCLSDAMDKIEVSVARAEKQKTDSERRYTEVACTNRHLGVQNVENEINEAIGTDYNRLHLIKTHCEEDVQRIDTASNTLDRVYNNSKQHSKQLNILQIRELERNKKEQEELEARLHTLRESAKKIAKQREHAAKQDKSAERMYEQSRENIVHWRDEITGLQTQTQHASSVLSLVQECSNYVTQDFYNVHKQYLSDLNTLAVESLQLYRKCLVGRIIAFKFRNQELETNIYALQALMSPKKEELKNHRRTGLKVMADKLQTQLEELGQYKHSYMSAKQSIDPLLEDAFQKLGILDTAIMHRVPDARLESVDDLYEEERQLQDNEWENYEMQSLTKAYY